MKIIGLEYILTLYEMQHIDLAESLGIKKQNINMWIKEKQRIPKKYLPILKDIFNINEEYFNKNIDDIDRLEIQKEKLKKDLNPIVEKQEQRYGLGELVNVPIYDREEINDIELTIEKTKLIHRFKSSLEIVKTNPYIDTFKLIVEILEKAQHEVIVHKTIEALAHYLEVLPDGITTGDAQSEFESEIFEVFDDNNF